MTSDLTPGSRVHCPLCQKAVKVTKDGKLARHGYGYRNGDFIFNVGGTCAAGGTRTAREAFLRQAETIRYYAGAGDPTKHPMTREEAALVAPRLEAADRFEARALAL